MSEAVTGLLICCASPKHGKPAFTKRLEQELGLGGINGGAERGVDLGETVGAFGVGCEGPSIVAGVGHAGEEGEEQPVSLVSGVNQSGDGVGEAGAGYDLVEDATLAGNGDNSGVVGNEAGHVGELDHGSDGAAAASFCKDQPSTTEVGS